MSERQRRLDRGPRWGLYFLAFLALLVLILLGAWAMWSSGSARRLERQVALYKAAGEPIELADFRETPVDDDDNAVVALRDAAKIDEKTKEWEAYDKLSFAGLPLRDKEVAAIRAVVAANPGAFDGI